MYWGNNRCGGWLTKARRLSLRPAHWGLYQKSITWLTRSGGDLRKQWTRSSEIRAGSSSERTSDLLKSHAIVHHHWTQTQDGEGRPQILSRILLVCWVGRDSVFKPSYWKLITFSECYYLRMLSPWGDSFKRPTPQRHSWNGKRLCRDTWFKCPFFFNGWICVPEGELLASLRCLRDHLPPRRERSNGNHCYTWVVIKCTPV